MTPSPVNPLFRARGAWTRRCGAAHVTLGSAVALLLVALTGCDSVGDLRFVRDQRVEILSPRPLSEIAVPATFRWRSSLPAGQRYALILGFGMVDPGRPVTDLVPADGRCRVTGDCRSTEALADADVYLTTGTSVTVPKLPALPVNQTSIEARLVLVDADGRRQGESLWYVTLRLPQAVS